MKQTLTKKLTLNRETVRKLTATDLRQVVGGTTGPTFKRCPTRVPGVCECLSTSNDTRV